VKSTREFDLFYKSLVKEIDLFDVNSSLSMEVLKNETALPL
jgi:Lrp/AsnC family transcriptional regulator